MGSLPTKRLALAPTSLITTSTSHLSPTRPTTRIPQAPTLHHHPVLHVRRATFIPRPRRPYTFTQLIQLSDGSTYTVRTTSPLPLYRASKDTRNTLTWQPSEKSLRNVELDEAGKLAAFRERFGRGFDASSQGGGEEGGASAGAAADSAASAPAEGQDDGLDAGFADLLAEYAPQDTSALRDSGPKKAPTRRK